MPKPIEVNNLVWNNHDAQQISLSWSYDRTTYNTTELLITFFDNNLGVSGSLIVDASIDVLQNDLYSYIAYLNKTNTQLSNLHSSDTLNCSFLYKILMD
jgi:hypothetical protein